MLHFMVGFYDDAIFVFTYLKQEQFTLLLVDMHTRT